MLTKIDNIFLSTFIKAIFYRAFILSRNKISVFLIKNLVIILIL